MRQVTGQFIFHNAGQGLFYSGNVSDFNFIYDCGSDRKQHLNEILIGYKTVYQKVDLLILSHLHEDHVSGIYTLFHNLPKTQVKTVILPYLSPIERLILAMVPRDPFSGDWYYDFLANPAQFLLERGVGRVIYIAGNEPKESGDLQPRDLDNGFDERSDDYTDKLKDSYSLRKTLSQNEPSLRQYLTSKRLLTKTCDGELIFRAGLVYWKFKFFNCFMQPQSLQSFSNCVNNLLHTDNIAEIISNEARRAQLRTCYGVLGSANKTNFNNTSLMVLHGPVDYRTGYPRNPAQFLTGDVNFKNKFTEITNHFGQDLTNINVSLVPHHGSVRNWDNRILPFVSSRCRWVVSTGKNNKSQPSTEILSDIKARGQSYSISDDDCKLTFTTSHNLLIDGSFLI